MTTQTPEYIKALITPKGAGRGSRKAWGIDVEQTWVPFFTATNVMGETKLPDDVLGAPIRLAKSKDGDVRFNQSGRPVLQVHPVLKEQIGVVQENFVASLHGYTGSVRDERPDAYGQQVKSAYEAAQPIFAAEDSDVEHAIEMLKLQAEAEAEAASEGDDSSEETTPEAASGSSRAHTRNSKEPAGAGAPTS